MGQIIFVGGSSGDPGLFTVSGVNALRQAEIVFYDRLVNPLLLLLVGPETILVDVGKRPNRKEHSQGQIGQQLAKAAQRFQYIVRLKGGDPSIFGRLDEELQVVKEKKINFRIIPGITSASALAAYSSISLTKRGVSRGVTLLTGHQVDHTNSVLSTLSPDQTLVVYMGVQQIQAIQAQLLTQFPRNLPVLIGQQVSYGRQKLWATTLEEMGVTVLDKKVQNPALFLFGAVAQDYDQAENWFEQQPLLGQKLLLFVPKLDYDLAIRYAELGADVWQISADKKQRHQFSEITSTWWQDLQPNQVLLTGKLTEEAFLKLELPEYTTSLQFQATHTFLRKKGIF